MNLAAILDAHPDEALALVDRDERVSYGDLRERIAIVRTALDARGVQRGDRVALLAENTIGVVVGYFAVLGLGAIAVPLNPLAPAVAIAQEVSAVGATVVLADRAAPEGLDVIRVEDLSHGSNNESQRVIDVPDDTVAVLMFTSGTAGAPKAAMLTHGNLRSNLDQALLEPEHIRAGDVVLGLLPLHHIFGLNVMLALGLIGGATVVFTAHFEPTETLELVRAAGITVIPGVPTMWIAWSKLADLDHSSFAGVRLALTGAAHMPEDIARDFHRRTGVVIREGYGLTEASPVVTTSMGDTTRQGSIGRVLSGVEARLIDEQGEDALASDPGELWLRGPNVFPGYWEDPEATARVLTADGWLRTGDVAVVDEDGFLYLVDRSKDLIIVSGFNVFPAEVEDTLLLHDAVAQAAVIGIPNPATGEAVKAFVVLLPNGQATQADLMAHCRSYLARYKCPGSIVFVDELPRGLGGKILRRLLR